MPSRTPNSRTGKGSHGLPDHLAFGTNKKSVNADLIPLLTP